MKGLDHFMKKHTATMSGAGPFHDKTDWYYEWSLTISWQNTLLLCLGLDPFMTKHTAWNGQASAVVAVCFVMKWSSPRHSSSVQNRLILCLELDHFMTKPSDTISGVGPFHNKTDWYYVWGLTISWQNKHMSALSWNGQARDIVAVCFVMKWWSIWHSIGVFCHEIVKPHT
jgi:hypothetical protein